MEYAQLYPESQLPTVRESSQLNSSERSLVVPPIASAATWSTEIPTWMSLPDVFFGWTPVRKLPPARA